MKRGKFMEGNNSIKKSIVLAVILLFVSVSVIPSTGTNAVEKTSTASFDGNTLYVGGGGPGNYSTIQEAINNASDGDTVFVYNDSSPYYENVVVNKIINLVGEDRSSTIIDGNESFSVLEIYGDGVNISGFTIQNGEYGIFIFGDGCTIINSCIKNNDQCGISLSKYHDCVIIDNEITDNDGGLDIYYSSNIKILGNIISDNSEGVALIYNTERVLIEGNIISNNAGGLGIIGSSNNIISGNEFSRNWLTIVLIKNLDAHSTNNKIVNNNFIRNRFPIFQVRDICSGNFYDGNYWNRPRLLPKWIPLHFNFDWHPAQEPYDIDGGDSISVERNVHCREGVGGYVK